MERLKVWLSAQLFAGVALMTFAVASPAQSLSSQDVQVKFVAASSSVFRATSNAFHCLFEARANKGSASTESAVAELDKAAKEYADIARDRKGTRFVEGNDETQRAAVKDVRFMLSTIREPRWTKVTELETEGHVAQMNVDAIMLLKRQLEDLKTCKTPTKDPKVFIEFIRNKINLERSSQIAEIAFNK